MKEKEAKVPSIIWFLWLQGIDKAPYIARKCLDSWKKYHPGWKINILDENNIKEHIDIEDIVRKNKQHITMQAFSDILRINLLRKHGGVWVDSTCFCCKPLDDWLHDYMDTGFFVFCNPGPDRPISSWFMASRPGSLIASIYCKRVNLYWRKNCFSNQNNKFGKLIKQKGEKVLRGNSYDSIVFRTSFLLMRTLRTYPYYWIHYIFALTMKKDPLFKNEWEQTRKISADIPHKMQHIGLFKPLTADTKIDIDRKAEPLYKLTHKQNKNMITKNTLLDYLLK